MKQNVLLIEDDQWLADSMLTTLRSRGHNVTQLSTAHEAMSWINDHSPSLIIADVLLGEHNTFTLFHELQSYPDTAAIPVIVCTSLDTKEFKQANMINYGVVEVLDKTSLTPERLLLCVESHLPETTGVIR